MGKSQAEATARALDYSTPRALTTGPAVASAAAPAVAPAVAPAGNVIPGTSTITNVPQGSPTPGGIKDVPPPGGTAPAPAPARAPAAAPAGGPAAATPDAKSGFPTTGNPQVDKYFKGIFDSMNQTPETVEQRLARKEKYLGPDESVQKERARLMSSKSSIQDEKYREFNMNAALFFAKMATTPGNLAFAALTALKNTIPTFVASDKEKGKLFREIDKGLADLDKAARLEKSGNYDAAERLVAETAKDQHAKVGKVISYFQAINVAEKGKEGKIAAAKISAGPISDLKERNLERQIEEGIDKVKNSDVYKDHVKALRFKQLPDYAKNPTMQKRVADAEEALQKFEADFSKRRKERVVDNTSSAAAPGGSLAPGKDGSFDYVLPKT